MVQKDRILERKDEQLTEKDALLIQKDELLVQKDEEVAGKDTQLARQQQVSRTSLLIGHFVSILIMLISTFSLYIQILNSVRANAATKDGVIADKNRQLSEQESRIADLISQREAALVERAALLQVL